MAGRGRVQKILLFVVAAVVALGVAANFFTVTREAALRIPRSMSVVGAGAVLALWLLIELILRWRGVPWTTGGEAARLRGLGPAWKASFVGVAGLFLLPLVIARPPPPAPKDSALELVDWRGLLLSGRPVVAVVEQKPSGYENSQLIVGQKYRITYQSKPCEWITTGPVQHQVAGLVRNFTSRGGPELKPSYGESEMTFNRTPCGSPADYKLVLLNSDIAYDANGVLWVNQPNPALGSGGWGSLTIRVRFGHLEVGQHGSV